MKRCLVSAVALVLWLALPAFPADMPRPRTMTPVGPERDKGAQREAPAADGLAVVSRWECSSDDRVDVECFEPGDWQWEYSRPVVWLYGLGDGSGHCSGFLCSPGGHILTASHCVSDQSEADQALVRFGYRREGCGWGGETYDFGADAVHGLEFIVGGDQNGLDYAFLKLRPQDDISRIVSEHGYLQLGDSEVQTGQQIYIPQQDAADRALGQLKTIDADALVSNHAWCSHVETFGHQGYIEPGSSGSPVLDRATHRVVGIVSQGACNLPCWENTAARMSLILPEIEQFVHLPGWVDLLSPLSGTYYSPVLFEWDPAIEATGYELQIDDNTDFDSPRVVNTSGTSYALGVDPGTWYWRVRAENSSGYGDWTSLLDVPQLTVIEGSSVSLTNGHVEPESGTENTDFWYYVHYYDPDAVPPLYKRVSIDWQQHTMSFYQGEEWNGWYRYGPVSHPDGQHEYYFYFESADYESARFPPSSPETIPGPFVGSGSNHHPVLSEAYVTPPSGDQINNSFDYYVYYYDEDGDPPDNVTLWVSFPEVPYWTRDMTLVSGDPSDGVYHHGPELMGPGEHTFMISCEDEYQYSASTGILSGPTVADDLTTVRVDWAGGGDFLNIQEGIDHAYAGDTVRVAPGTYTGALNRNLDFQGKAIALIGTAGADSTIIDCEGAGRGLLFHSGEDTTSIVSGFTVTGAVPITYNGAGICCLWSSSPTVANCVITGNTAEGVPQNGGGMSCLVSSSPRLVNVAFTNNHADGSGGGLYVTGESQPRLANVAFQNNTAEAGGGMSCYYSSCPVLDDVTFSGNSAVAGGGMLCENGCSPVLASVTFEGNEAGWGGGLLCRDSSSPSLTRVMFIDNTATYGGGMHCFSECSPNLDHVWFAGNSAQVGGAILWTDSPQSVSHGVFANNSAGEWGGALFADLWPAVEIVDCTFFGNGAPIGGHVCSAQGTTAVVVTNSIMSGSVEGEPLAELDGVGSAGFDVSFSCVYQNAGGDSLPGEHHDNLFANPLFCDATVGDFTLRDDSQCLPENNPWGELIGGIGAGDCATGLPDEEKPLCFALYPVTPNPFGPRTHIVFDLPSSSDVTVAIYNIAGRRVKTMVAGAYMEAGQHVVPWNGHDDTGRRVASGVYFCRVRAGGEETAQRMVLLR